VILIFRKELEDESQNEFIQKTVPIGVLVSESKPTLTKICIAKHTDRQPHAVRGLDFASLQKPMGDGRYDSRRYIRFDFYFSFF
jgi:hypothetical protein